MDGNAPVDPAADSALLEPRSTYRETELIFALVGAVGTNLQWMENALCDRLRSVGYAVAEPIHLSSFLNRFALQRDDGTYIELKDKPEEDRILTHMEAGNALRRENMRENPEGGGDILAILAIQKMQQVRGGKVGRTAYVINSLKHPHEIYTLRRIYGPGLFVIGVHSPRHFRSRRLKDLIAASHKTTNLEKYKSVAEQLIEKDEFEPDDFGQQVRDTFKLADIFISLPNDSSQSQTTVQSALERFLRVILGNPFETPTPQEYLMFHAHAAAVRSGSLPRQVGAVIGSERHEVLAAGCNDAPRAEGGLYWPRDADVFRDIERGVDSSDEYKKKIVEELLKTTTKYFEAKKGDIPEPVLEFLRGLLTTGEKATNNAISVLKGTRLMDLIEFGRSVHAEAEAILGAGRNGVSTKGKDLYTTTFPCHDCAKLIIAAGIKEVIYIEPYPKSLALELNADALDAEGVSRPRKKGYAQFVKFTPFVGVGPRRYLDFFSLTTSTGSRIARKDKDGRLVDWVAEKSRPRLPMLPTSYLEREDFAIREMKKFPDKDK